MNINDYSVNSINIKDLNSLDLSDSEDLNLLDSSYIASLLRNSHNNEQQSETEDINRYIMVEDVKEFRWSEFIENGLHAAILGNYFISPLILAGTVFYFVGQSLSEEGFQDVVGSIVKPLGISLALKTLSPIVIFSWIGCTGYVFEYLYDRFIANGSYRVKEKPKNIYRIIDIDSE